MNDVKFSADYNEWRSTIKNTPKDFAENNFESLKRTNIMSKSVKNFEILLISDAWASYIITLIIQENYFEICI